MAKTSLRFERKEFELRVWRFLSNCNILPKNIDFYYLAFVHRSVLNESSMYYGESNERLEFLWDAILELVITEKLFLDFPNKTEWELTDIRSAVVRWRNLASVASLLWISDVIQLSRWEFKVLWHENPYILANAMEALLWAIYLDFGFNVVRDFILKHIYSTLSDILKRGLYVDPKSHLQEITQDIWWYLPIYEVVGEDGQDHNKIYKICVSLGDCILWEWKGTSKKKWEQDAAENAIAQQDVWKEKITFPKKYDK